MMSHINWAFVMSFMFASSEALAVIPSVKSNSVFQAILNVMDFIKQKVAPQAPAAAPVAAPVAPVETK